MFHFKTPTPSGEQTTTIEGVDLDLVLHAPYRPRVLIIDDDPDMVFLLKAILREAGFDVTGANHCREAITKCLASKPDAILLDLMMPDIDGWDTYEQIRQVSDAPVMIISALSAKETVVRGLLMGADDYLTKPFFNAEVVARLRKIVQRASERPGAHPLYFPSIQLGIDPDAHQATLRGAPIHLTGREFSLLELLARRAPRVVRYEEIARQIWHADNPDVRKSIKYIVYLLRRKLETDPADPKLLLNVEQQGYRLQTEPLIQ